MTRPPSRGWLEQQLFASHRALAVTITLMIEQDPGRVAIHIHAEEPADGKTVALEQHPWAQYSSPLDIVSEIGARVAPLLREIVDPF